MITCLVASLVLGMAPKADPQTIDLTPTDDIWVYPHASDPSKDPFLRAWGSEGMSVAPSASETGEFSYSFLKFDLSSLAGKGEVTGATLILTMTADPGYTLANAKENPLEVRSMANSNFTEKGWAYDMISTIAPDNGAKAIFGKSAIAEIPSGKEFPVSIDLSKSDNSFAKYAAAALGAKVQTIGLALTSTIDPSTGGRTAVYRFFSKDTDKKENRPVLRISLK